MDIEDDDWELSPDTAHPTAAELMQEAFFWDVTDENSPFGNDSGADALELYREARAEDPDLDSREFLVELLEQWDVDTGFAQEIPEEELAERLEREHFHILTYDDAIVGVAFAELVMTGTVNEDIAEAAIHSLERQALPELLEFRGWSDPAERRERCEQMISVLRRSV
ncbi:MAG TPA: hypothetical protein VFK48_18205 [Usitatibacter sp.]|nr:hypothetical protein [Usitatibacter sp.]